MSRWDGNGYKPPEDPHGYNTLFQAAILAVGLTVLVVLVAAIVIGTAASAR